MTPRYPGFVAWGGLMLMVLSLVAFLVLALRVYFLVSGGHIIWAIAAQDPTEWGEETLNWNLFTLVILGLNAGYAATWTVHVIKQIRLSQKEDDP